MKRFQNILECLIVSAIVLFGGLYLGKLLNPDYTDASRNAVAAFQMLPEESVEVIVYGSSHAWDGLDPLTMYENHGIGAYNYGGNWQNLNTSFLFFKDSLRTQKPKVVLFETYQINSVLSDVDMDGEIYYTKELPMSRDKIQYLHQCFGNDPERWASYFFPVTMFHSSWVSIDAENFSEGTPAAVYLSSMGASLSDKIAEIERLDPQTFEQRPLEAASIGILDQILEICAQNEIDVVFYTAPYGWPYHYSQAIKEYAQAHDCQYIDFFELYDDVGFDASTDFQDHSHLNKNGAVKVSNYLGRFISDHYNLTDMRTVENNLWATSLADRNNH